MQRVMIVEATIHYDDSDEEESAEALHKADKVEAFAKRQGCDTFIQDSECSSP